MQTLSPETVAAEQLAEINQMITGRGPLPTDQIVTAAGVALHHLPAAVSTHAPIYSSRPSRFDRVATARQIMQSICEACAQPETEFTSPRERIRLLTRQGLAALGVDRTGNDASRSLYQAARELQRAPNISVAEHLDQAYLATTGRALYS